MLVPLGCIRDATLFKIFYGIFAQLVVKTIKWLKRSKSLTVETGPLPRRAFGVSALQIFWHPLKFCCAQKIFFKHTIRKKIFSEKIHFAPPNLNAWLRA